jgi:hypothetical protein
MDGPMCCGHRPDARSTAAGRLAIGRAGWRQAPAAAADPCAGNDSGITLPPGFCATVFADNIGHARQMVVAPNGVVYVDTWSGTYFRNDMAAGRFDRGLFLRPGRG